MSNKPSERRILEYRIVTDIDPRAFQQEVENQCNDEGWRLHGGASICTEMLRVDSDLSYEVTRYAQALVRYRTMEAAEPQ